MQGYDTFATGLGVSVTHARHLLTAAEALATTAVRDKLAHAPGRLRCRRGRGRDVRAHVRDELRRARVPAAADRRRSRAFHAAAIVAPRDERFRELDPADARGIPAVARLSLSRRARRTGRSGRHRQADLVRDGVAALVSALRVDARRRAVPRRTRRRARETGADRTTGATAAGITACSDRVHALRRSVARAPIDRQHAEEHHRVPGLRRLAQALHEGGSQPPRRQHRVGRRW